MFNRELKEEIEYLKKENKYLEDKIKLRERHIDGIKGAYEERINSIAKEHEAKISELESMLTPKQRLAIKSTDELLRMAEEYRVDTTELTKNKLIEEILAQEAMLKRG